MVWIVVILLLLVLVICVLLLIFQPFGLQLDKLPGLTNFPLLNSSQDGSEDEHLMPEEPAEEHFSPEEPEEEHPPEAEPQEEHTPPEEQPKEEPEMEVQADMEIIDIRAEHAAGGKLILQLRNNGPTPLRTMLAGLECEVFGVPYGGSGAEDTQNIFLEIIVQLDPGQSDDFETGIAIDLNDYRYDAHCVIHMEIDPNPGNNEYFVTLAK
ncbi:MAG: hypothetical protein MUO76_17765 [Anaerolineaceae bacterium]|nr:hypothetical protein [Anaerolineaceae bacterium]